MSSITSSEQLTDSIVNSLVIIQDLHVDDQIYIEYKRLASTRPINSFSLSDVKPNALSKELYIQNYKLDTNLSKNSSNYMTKAQVIAVINK